MRWKIKKTDTQETGAAALGRRNISLSEIQNKKRMRRKMFWVFLWSLAVFTCTCLFLRWLMWSPYFKVRNMEYSGINHASQEEIKNFIIGKAAGGTWLQRVIGYESILSWPDEVSWGSPAYLPLVSEIKVRKNFWQRSLAVAVAEFKPIGIWCSALGEADRCAWFDAEGRVIERAPLAEGGLIPVVKDMSGVVPRVGSYIFESSDRTQNLLSIFRVLYSEKIPVQELRLERAIADEVKVFQSEGPEMYFSLRFPADSTQGPMRALKEKGWTKLQYIDFRIENRAYYK